MATASEMWEKYGAAMWKHGDGDSRPAPVRPTPEGIAVGKPIKATATDGQQTAGKANDGNLSLESSWWAKGPASLTIDLGKETRLTAFQVYPYWDGRRHYQYTIEVSTDGKDWKQAVDMSKNTQPATPAGHLHNFKVTMPEGFPARYARLNMLRNSANPGVHVVEFKLFTPDIELDQ